MRDEIRVIALMAEWLHLSPEEATAVHLNLRVALWAMTASLNRAFSWRWCWHADGSGEKRCSTGWFTCRWSPVVTGYLLLLGRRGPLGQFLDEHFGIVFAFRWTGAALACAVMGFPLMVRAIRLSIEAVDRRLEGAAATNGAGPVWVFLVITLPLALPGIIAGMILSFARSMGEFGATITFVANIPGETQTLPSAIYTLTQIPGGDAGALRLTLISIAISMLALLAAEFLARRLSRILPGS
jgi:molybdate transport system permease protein